MNENLLQYIWQFQYFNRGELKTTEGEDLQILSPGQHNMQQGPDFSNALIRINETTWAGTVELHIKTSDWNKHHHANDHHYGNVILHVVWEDDGAIAGIASVQGNAARVLPLLELRSRVSKILLSQYEELMNASAFIPCENAINSVPPLHWTGWKERLLAERLIRKKATIEEYLIKNNYHWEETFWWLLARNFGVRHNQDAFEAMARSLPINVLSKHKLQIHQLEALIFGQAGLLIRRFKESYPEMLRKEYRFLRAKYKLEFSPLPLLFLRMRPVNFPTIRLAQLAMLVHRSTHLFATCKETERIEDIKKLFSVEANDYWHYHYRFDELSAFKPKTLGPEMINNIFINTLIPMLFAYAEHHKEDKYRLRALLWLEQIPAESNVIIKSFDQLGIESKTAFDSQALLELKTSYCDCKRCLQCGVGGWLLQSQTNKK